MTYVPESLFFSAFFFFSLSLSFLCPVHFNSGSSNKADRNMKVSLRLFRVNLDSFRDVINMCLADLRR